MDNFDSALSLLGRQQAAALGALLSAPSPSRDSAPNSSWFDRLGMRDAAFFVSPCSRTLLTAQAGFSGKLVASGGVPHFRSSELLRANIGRDVCNYRRTVRGIGASPAAAGPPFATLCNSSLTDPGLDVLFGNASGISFSFNVRPSGAAVPGSVDAFGLVGDADSLWRSDTAETESGNAARAAAFLRALFSPGMVTQRMRTVSHPDDNVRAQVSESVAVVVTHGEIVDAVWMLTTGETARYGAANTELVPMVVELAAATETS